MSAFAAIAYADAAFLFSDRAVWNADETLHSVRTKIAVAECGHLAVTTKGCAENGAKVAKMLCDRADRYGAAATIAEMQEFATWVGEQLGVDDSGLGLKVCSAAWLPGKGGVYSAFQSSRRGQNASSLAGTRAITIEPYIASEPRGGIHWSGGIFHVADIAGLGLARRPGEHEYDWSRRLGLGIMETMRARLGAGADGKASIVGGGIDMVALGPKGAVLERLVDWPDPIGLPVDPLRSMSRAERRRVMRMLG